MAVTTFAFENVPPAAFALLVDSIRAHGVQFLFKRRNAQEAIGSFSSPAGAGTFAHQGNKLQINILENRGHFPPLMLKGGLRQLVQEAIELHQLGEQQSAQQHAASQ